MPDKPILSIGIIFKNEIRCLERCLQSLTPLRESVACELVMADTGATDGSREIAEKYADILIDFPWIDDFAAARNAVLDRCTGTWHLTIDSDEWLEDIAPLKQFLKKRALWTNVSAGIVTQRNYVSYDNQENYSDFLALRLMRRTKGVRYEGAIHEVFTGTLPKGKRLAELSNVILHHDGYVNLSEEQGAAKRKRNMDLLKGELEKDPENLRLYLLCFESAEKSEKEEYLRSAIAGVDAKWKDWDLWGASIYRYGVSTALRQKWPEQEEWAERARNRFPKSAFTRVDVAHAMFWLRVDQEDYAKIITEGETYLSGLRDYRAGKCLLEDRGTSSILFSSSQLEQRVRVLLSDAYFHEKDYEKARETLASVAGDKLEATFAALYIKSLMNLQSHSALELGEILQTFWKEISKPTPTKEAAEQRQKAVREAAYPAFSTAYQQAEDKQGFRHAWTVFGSLAGMSSLGDAAAILQAEDEEEQKRRFAAVSDWTVMPISVLGYGLERHMLFPQRDRPLRLEEADLLASRLALEEPQAVLALACTPQPPTVDIHILNWRRAVLMSALSVFPWKKKEDRTVDDTQLGMKLANAFMECERRFLPVCYTQGALEGSGILLLPPLHRFGYWLSKAFDAVENGNATEGVRMLREGLKSAPERRDMVEFLLDEVERQAEKPKIPDAPPELWALAEKVKDILHRYPPDDPAVQELKSSPVYQRVAWLLEEPVTMVAGVVQ